MPHVLADHAGVDGRVPQRRSDLPQRLFPLERGVVRPPALPARPEPQSAVSQGRRREGVLPHPLAHERDDPGAGPSVFHDPRPRRHVRAAERPARRVTRSSAGTSASASAARVCASSAAGPPRSTSRCRSRTRDDAGPPAAATGRQDARGDLPHGVRAARRGVRRRHLQRARSGAAVGRRQPRIEPAHVRGARDAAAARAGRAGRDARREPDAEGGARHLPGGGARPAAADVKAQLLETIDRELAKVAARIESDAIVLVDVHQNTLAAAGRLGDRWPRGRPVCARRPAKAATPSTASPA